MFRETYDPFTSNQEHQSQTITSKPTGSTSISLKNTSKTTEKTNQIQNDFSNSITKQKYFSMTQTDQTKNNNNKNNNNHNEKSIESKLNVLKSEKKWHEFENNVRSTLQWRSPAKHSNGLSAHNFTRQVAKIMMPVEDKLHESTQILESFPNSNSMFQAMTSLNHSSPSFEINNHNNNHNNHNKTTKLLPLDRSISTLSQTNNNSFINNNQSESNEDIETNNNSITTPATTIQSKKFNIYVNYQKMVYFKKHGEFLIRYMVNILFTINPQIQFTNTI